MRWRMSVKTLVVLVLFFAALCAPGFGYTVLWDISHGVAEAINGGEYQPGSGELYYNLAEHLRNNGFTVETTSEGFNAENLAGADVAVVCITSPSGLPYTAGGPGTEASLLAGFVDTGGGLLIMGSHPFLFGGTGNGNIQPVAGAFGIMLGASNNIYSGSYTPDALEHPVFAGFTGTEKIYMPAAGEITIGENGFALVRQSATGPILIAGANHGDGRVVALGDFNMFSEAGNAFDRDKNHDFALNTFNWLAVPEPATILLLAAGAALLRRRR